MSTLTDNLGHARFGKLRRAGFLAAMAVTLGGCVDRDMSDLQRYVENVLSREAPVIAPLPQIKPYELYAYRSSEKKDPFEPFFTQGEEVVDPTPRSCPGPDPDRIREELEGFPIDSLRMVGTIERGETLWGVVRNQQGAIFRVTIDNFLGRNHGRIIDIREEAIDLIEIVPDGQGCYQERNTQLALSE
jgi:type IV pilus assembly protein PilP